MYFCCWHFWLLTSDSQTSLRNTLSCNLWIINAPIASGGNQVMARLFYSGSKFIITHCSWISLLLLLYQFRFNFSTSTHKIFKFIFRFNVIIYCYTLRKSLKNSIVNIFFVHIKMYRALQVICCMYAVIILWLLKKAFWKVRWKMMI